MGMGTCHLVRVWACEHGVVRRLHLVPATCTLGHPGGGIWSFAIEFVLSRKDWQAAGWSSHNSAMYQAAQWHSVWTRVTLWWHGGQQQSHVTHLQQLFLIASSIAAGAHLS